MKHAIRFLMCSLALAACAPQDAEVTRALAAHDAVLNEIPREFYSPGLGDQMLGLQHRHAALWFAAQAGNWSLAAFELEEVDETLERIGRWHPKIDGVPTPPSIKAYTHPARYALAQSITKRSRADFEVAFDRLTDGCNACHHASKHPFIVIQRPSASPVSNQRWSATE